MRTQTLVSLLFIIVALLFSTQINSHSTIDNHNDNTVQARHTATPDNTNKPEPPHQMTFVLTEDYHVVHAHTGDEDSHFLHFHFNRLRRDRRYYKVQIITCKLLLIIVHILLLSGH